MSTTPQEGSEGEASAAIITHERRSKANSNKAWAGLMPAKRGKTSEDEEEQQQLEPGKPASTPAIRGAKRTRTKKESPVSPKEVKKDSPPPSLTPQPDKYEANEYISAMPVKNEDLATDDTGMMQLSKMEEGYFDEMEDPDDSHDYIDDPNDKDFEMEAMPQPMKGVRGKAACAVTNNIPAPVAPTLRPITAASSAFGPIVVPRNATTVLSSTGKPLKIVKLNGATMRGARLVGQRIVSSSSAMSLTAGAAAPSTSAVPVFWPVSGGSTDPPVSSMVSSASKEVAEIMLKFKDRLIPGQTVAEFSKIIDTLKVELAKMAEDRQRITANHRETLDNIQLHYNALLDLKESRIRQLDIELKNLQKKLHDSIDNHLTQLLKNESSTAAPEPVAEK
ncbi:hypothetical protein QR680_018675 [Steinernema hermaphroditum]|uniref:Uncharacterized protein n=1 Tax=Steinernema hermaphroditum TaxID=289476 RepID=A0AA39LRG3_9BILA|nr:hypothetical protein QR680_018675 [Steinernema hermaphroditum]